MDDDDVRWESNISCDGIDTLTRLGYLGYIPVKECLCGYRDMRRGIFHGL